MRYVAFLFPFQIDEGDAFRGSQEGAYVDITVKLGLVKIVTQRVDICQQVKDSDKDIECPIKEGEYTVEQTVTIPGVAPLGPFLLPP